MLLPDVNIFVYAQREEMPTHAWAKTWLESALNSAELVGVFDPILASFLRITTNRRIFKTPTPLPLALSFVETIRAAPMARPLVEVANHWEIFARICRQINAVGDDIPDAYIAALAIQHDCELISSDQGFARFEGLRWRNPF
jgi:toxin-antitoxin system PIN domain toxin